MRIFLCSIALVTTWFVGYPAYADDQPGNQYNRCIRQLGSEPATQKACGEKYLQRLDVALNVAWKRVYSLMNGNDDDRNKTSKAIFLAEQRAWLNYRDAACIAFENSYFEPGKTIQQHYVCKGAILENRIKQLEAYCQMNNDCNNSMANKTGSE